LKRSSNNEINKKNSQDSVYEFKNNKRNKKGIKSKIYSNESNNRNRIKSEYMVFDNEVIKNENKNYGYNKINSKNDCLKICDSNNDCLKICDSNNGTFKNFIYKNFNTDNNVFPYNKYSLSPKKNNKTPGKSFENRVFKDLYNFDHQFMFSQFKKENLDSFFTLQRKYSSKSEKKIKSLEQTQNSSNFYSTNCSNFYGQKIHNKRFNNSDPEIKFISEQFKNKSYSKKSRNFYFEKLYNDRFILQNKILNKKFENEKNFLKNSKPKITLKAKNIIRDPNLFHCRLYPYHKIDTNSLNISGFANKKKTITENFDYNSDYIHSNLLNRSISSNLKNINKNVENFESIKTQIKNDNSLNNTFSGIKNNIIENIKKLEGIYDVKSFKIYRTSKNKFKNNETQLKNLNNINSKEDRKRFKNLDYIKNNYTENYLNQFTFNPKINKKSKKIAETLEDSKTRLLKRRRKFSYSPLQDSNFSNKLNIKKNYSTIDNNIQEYQHSKNESINNANNIIYHKYENRIFNNSFDNIGNPNPLSLDNHNINDNLIISTTSKIDKFKLKTKRMNKDSKSQQYEFVIINNTKIPSRLFSLYNRGLESLKKKEAKSMEKQIQDNLFYKTFSYKPQTNKRISPSIYRGKAIKLGQSDSHRNISSYNLFDISNQNFNNFNSQTLGNIIYEKQLIWKNNVDRKTKILKEEKNIKENKECTYHPAIIRDEMPNDEKFIEKNLNQIQDYVNKRRASILKSKEDENYKEKRLNLNIKPKKFVKKPTLPIEFNITKINTNDKLNQGDLKFQQYFKGKSVNNSSFKIERKNFHSIQKFRNQFNTNNYFDFEESNDKNKNELNYFNKEDRKLNEKSYSNIIDREDNLFLVGSINPNLIKKDNYDYLNDDESIVQNEKSKATISGKSDFQFNNKNYHHYNIHNVSNNDMDSKYLPIEKNLSITNLNENCIKINQSFDCNSDLKYNNFRIPNYNESENYSNQKKFQLYSNDNSANCDDYVFKMYSKSYLGQNKIYDNNNSNNSFDFNYKNDFETNKTFSNYCPYKKINPRIKIFNLLNERSSLNKNENFNYINSNHHLSSSQNYNKKEKDRYYSSTGKKKGWNDNNFNKFSKNLKKSKRDYEVHEEKIDYPIDQQKFIDAVRNIHEKLINLKI